MDFRCILNQSGILLLGALLCLACNNGKNSVEKVPFKYIEPPVMMSQGEIPGYIARNFWRNYTPNVDSVSLDEASANFFGIILSADKKYTKKAVDNAFQKADSIAVAGEKRLLLRLISDAEKTFYNPNSPYLDEEVYLLFLENVLKSEALSETDKLSWQYQYDICSLNRVGTISNDFEFKALQPSGKFKVSNMHSLGGDYTLLFFNNPDCYSCAAILESLKESKINLLVKQGRLSVLAIYIDEQLEIWAENRERYPNEWIYAHDHKLILRDNKLYGLRAIPSMYLLDKEKRVILKDAPVEAVIYYLETI